MVEPLGCPFNTGSPRNLGSQLLGNKKKTSTKFRGLGLCAYSHLTSRDLKLPSSSPPWVLWICVSDICPDPIWLCHILAHDLQWLPIVCYIKKTSLKPHEVGSSLPISFLCICLQRVKVREIPLLSMDEESLTQRHNIIVKCHQHVNCRAQTRRHKQTQEYLLLLVCTLPSLSDPLYQTQLIFP